MDMGAIVIVALAVVAAGGALFALRVTLNRRSDSSTRTNIRDVRTLGDVAGRDIKKNDK
jgi:hypothetical protein